MALLKTKQGDDILLVPYRFEVEAKSRSTLVKAIKETAETLGDAREFCAVEQLDGGGYAVALHDQQGYILAESVWRHFDYPENLIWCEQLSDEDSDRVIIVIVKDNRIHLDGEIPLTALNQDIATSIGDGDQRFSIYTHGDVPLVSNNDGEFGKVALDRDRVTSFTELERSLVTVIDWNSSDKTHRISKSVSMAGLPNRAPFWLIGIVVTSMVLKLVLFAPKPEVETVVNDPFNEYRKALIDSPSVEAIAMEVIDRVALTSQLTTWKVVGLGSNGFQFDVVLSPLVSRPNFGEVKSLSNAMGVSPAFRDGKLYLTDSLIPNLPKRNIDQIVKVIDVIEHLYSSTRGSVFDLDILGASNSSKYRAQEFTLTAKGIAIDEIYGIHPIINGLPVKLISLETKPIELGYEVVGRFNILGL